jgi:putative oxidoreductase
MDKCFGSASDLASVIFIRLAVGLIFFTQGTLKYIDLHMGVLKFTKIGFPYPNFIAHFVGTFEMVCGVLVLLGPVHQARERTALNYNSDRDHDHQDPELWRFAQGFWFMVSDARTDFAMTMSLLFLISVGVGAWSLDASFGSENSGRNSGA